MTYYSEDFIEEVKLANDIVDVVSQYVTLKRQGTTYFGPCPFHREKTPSFAVTPDKQIYHCFGCGEGGNVIRFIMRVENIDKNDVDVLLGMMTNENYRIVIRKRYIEEKDHKEIAEELGVTMENYYNIHKRAKEQFVNIYKKEERYGK